jgi:molybdate transport system substrate-binding protein
VNSPASLIQVGVRNRAEPTRIMNGQADVGVTSASEVRFQESIGNPIQGIVIPTNQNTTAIYAGAVMANAPIADVPAEWRAFLKSQQAHAIYHKYDFRSIQHSSN